MRGRIISQANQSQILALSQAGHSGLFMSNQLEISHSTIYDILFRGKIKENKVLNYSSTYAKINKHNKRRINKQKSQ